VLVRRLPNEENKRHCVPCRYANELRRRTNTLGPEVTPGTPKELFSSSDIRANPGASFAVTRDGQRFLFVTGAEETNLTPFTVVLNWMAELKK